MKISKAVKHDIKRTIRSNLPIMITGLCVLLFLIPFSTAALPGNSIFDINVTHLQLKFRFIDDAFVPAVQIFAVLFGFVCGILSFRFVLDQSKSTAYFALGISRRSLYLSRFLTASVMILLITVLAVAVSLSLNLLSLGNYQGMIPAAIFITLGIFITMMIAFSIASIGCLISGTLAEALFFSATLLAIPYVLSYSANTFVKHLLWGNPFGTMPYLGDNAVAPSIVESLASFNPILFFFEHINTHYMFYRPLETEVPPAILPLSLIIWTIITTGFGYLGFWAIKKRRAEQASFSGKNKLFSRICTFVPLMFLCTLAFDLSASLSMLFGIILLIAVFLLCLYFGDKFIVNEPFSFNVKKLIHVSVRLVILLVFVLGAVAGYGTHVNLPTSNNVLGVEVSYAGSPNYIGVDALGSSNDTSFYFNADYSYESKEDIALAIDLHKRIDESGKKNLSGNENDFSETIVPYDIKFSYTLSDGKTKTWYYDRASLRQLKALLAFEKTAPVIEGIDYALSGLSNAQNIDDIGNIWTKNAYSNAGIVLTDPTFREMFELNLTLEDRKLLLESIKKDVLAQSSEDRYFPEGEPLGIIMFSFDVQNDIETFTYHLNNTFVHVDENFTNTLNFLQGKGLWLNENHNGSSEVESIIIQAYDPYIGINKPSFPQSPYFMSYLSNHPESFRIQKDFGRADTVKDPEMIEKILSEIRSSYYLSEEGYLVSIKYIDSDKWVYKFWPTEHSMSNHE